MRAIEILPFRGRQYHVHRLDYRIRAYAVTSAAIIRTTTPKTASGWPFPLAGPGPLRRPCLRSITFAMRRVYAAPGAGTRASRTCL
jgi:hypothetical protein